MNNVVNINNYRILLLKTYRKINMKTFRQFLAESVRLNEAVADIPADLKEVINKHYRNGMKQFLEQVYRSTSRDLNDLEMSNDNFIRTTKIT